MNRAKATKYEWGRSWIKIVRLEVYNLSSQNGKNCCSKISTPQSKITVTK